MRRRNSASPDCVASGPSALASTSISIRACNGSCPGANGANDGAMMARQSKQKEAIFDMARTSRRWAILGGKSHRNATAIQCKGHYCGMKALFQETPPAFLTAG